MPQEPQIGALLEGLAGEPLDSPAGLAVARHLLTVLPPDHAERHFPLLRLGLGYLLRFEARGDNADLRAARDHFGQLLAVLPAFDADVEAYAANIAARVALLEIEEGTAPADFDAVIDRLAAARHSEPPRERQRLFVMAVARASRFCWLGGGLDDYEAGLSGLTDLVGDPDLGEAQVSGCRMYIAMLALMKDMPESMRRDPSRITPAQISQLSGEVSTDSLRLAKQHIDAVSKQSLAGTPFASMLSIAQAMVTGAQPTQADQVQAALADLADLPDGPDRSMAIALLNARMSQLGGGQGAADEMFKEVTKAVGALEPDHPLHGPMTEAVGMLASRWSVNSRTATENATTAKLLADAMAVLPADHPARTTAAGRVALSSLINFVEDRSSQSIDEIADNLAEAVARPAEDPLTNAHNLLAHAKLTAFRGSISRDLGMIDEGIAHFDKAIELLPDDHAALRMADTVRSSMLLLRYMTSGSLEDIAAAQHFSSDPVEVTTPALAALPALQELIQLCSRLMESRNNLNADEVARHQAAIAEAYSRMRPDHPMYEAVKTLLPQLEVLRASSAVQERGFARTREEVEWLEHAVSTVLTNHQANPAMGFGHVHDVLSTAMAMAGPAMLVRDVKKFDQAIGMLGEVAGQPGLLPEEEVSLTQATGLILRMRYEVSRDHRDLNNAIERFGRTRQLLIDSPGGIDTAALLHSLADCYRARHDPGRGDLIRMVQIGLEAVRERAADVLLQTSDARALEMAKAAKNEAAEIASWCVAANRLDAAVQALELGRAMVLHATTFETTLGALLRERGQHEIAEQYERESAQQAPWNDGVQIPTTDPTKLRTDLRRRVLTAVADTDIADRLLAPPAIEDIVKALRVTNSTALIYLLPTVERLPGMAVVIEANGQVYPVELARLPAVLPESLTAQCDWAWTAAMERVLDKLVDTPAGPRRRLVLIPVGQFAAVPWHAARRITPNRTVRYACEDAVITYASSARQFLEASRRPARPWPEQPVIINVPGSKLQWAPLECKEVHRRCYPEGALLGGSVSGRNRVTLTKVRNVLPGGPQAASLLHLGCHGVLTNPPIESYLALSRDKAGRLRIREMLAAARNRRPDEPGGLVVLAACTSDRTDEMPDEVLTLATTFLTAGAVGAIGARWEVDDLPTAIFMVMFHHYLTAGYPDPATALRATQVWMLNPGRRLPADVDPLLAEELASFDPAQVAYWAAFTYQGR